MSTTPENDNGRSVAESRRNPIVVSDPLAMLDTGRFEMMNRIAGAMAAADLMPEHLRGKPADCLLVVNQAIKRNMDPLDLAQVTFVARGKLGYEGKVVAAWINASPDVEGRLRYDYSGDGDKRTVTVSGKLVDEDAPRTIAGTVGDWKTSNENWKKNPDSMLAYRGAREWARRHVPDLLLGVYTPDEMAEAPAPHGPAYARDITPTRPTRGDAGNNPDPDPGPVEDEPYQLIDGVGEVVAEDLGPAQFADDLTRLLKATGADIDTIWDNNADELARLATSIHAEGCYAPVHDLFADLMKAKADGGAEATTGEAEPEAKNEPKPEPTTSEPEPLRIHLPGRDGGWLPGPGGEPQVFPRTPAGATRWVETLSVACRTNPAFWWANQSTAAEVANSVPKLATKITNLRTAMESPDAPPARETAADDPLGDLGEGQADAAE